MIRKWELSPMDPLSLPPEAQVIHIGEQNGVPMVWTNDVKGNQNKPYLVEIFGTGSTPPPTALHLGTVQMPHNGLVWHVFQVDA